MKKQKLTESGRFGGFILIVFILYTFAVKFIDVDKIGPQNTEIGFSILNDFIRERFQYNELWYNISKYFGYIVILTAAMFALLGAIQLIRRKSFSKLDKNYISLGVFYGVVVILYVFFDKAAINYRPVILDEGLEPSYPSSHTMLAICVMGSAAIQFGRLIRSESNRGMARVIAIIIAVIVVAGRIMSGVHWITDIFGGVMLSAGLLIIYNSVYVRIEISERRRKRRRSRNK